VQEDIAGAQASRKRMMVNRDPSSLLPGCAPPNQLRHQVPPINQGDGSLCETKFRTLKKSSELWESESEIGGSGKAGLFSQWPILGSKKRYVQDRSLLPGYFSFCGMIVRFWDPTDTQASPSSGASSEHAQQKARSKVAGISANHLGDIERGEF